MTFQYRSESWLGERTEQFLSENNVHEGWALVFRENGDLNKLIRDLVNDIDGDMWGKGRVPERCNILRAFSYSPPECIKVVIVGHEPIQDPTLASGLSFSYPRETLIDEKVGDGRRSMVWGPGKSVPVVHDALCEAGILERGGTYDCCHEEWAERGVLLLNASLTLGKYWVKFRMEDFILEVLFQVAQRSKQSRIFYACWGTNAETVGNRLSFKMGECYINHQIVKFDDAKEQREGQQDARFVIYISHHPTYPRGDMLNGVILNFYSEQATIQFREMNERHPGIFNLNNLKIQGVGTESQGVGTEAEEVGTESRG